GLNDVGVAEPGSAAAFLEKHGHVVRVLGELRPELLDCDELAEPSGPMSGREIDDAHSAGRDLGDEAVFADGVAEGNDAVGYQHRAPRTFPMCKLQTHCIACQRLITIDCTIVIVSSFENRSSAP